MLVQQKKHRLFRAQERELVLNQPSVLLATFARQQLAQRQRQFWYQLVLMAGQVLVEVHPLL